MLAALRNVLSHSRSFRRGAGLAVVIVVAFAFLNEAGAQPSALDTKGPQAGRIADLWWFMLVLGGAVFIVVMALVIVAVVWRPREGFGHRFVFGAGIVVPLLILAAVFGVTLWTMSGLAGLRAPDATRVHVAGQQFWWDVRYPDDRVITANEIHIPVGEPVRLDITTADVIHSFWVPELAGKMDLIPGKTNTLWIQADQPGEYRGQCAEFCGIQHANMAFLVIAQPRESFDAWIEAQRAPATSPETETIARGREVFLSSACVYCHRVAGTNAQGELGPDLTHLASRSTIAAGTLANNRGNLAGWIIDPQAIKPGNTMPGIDLPSDDLQALLTYLQSLE